jgi:hypothetical protein
MPSAPRYPSLQPPVASSLPGPAAAHVSGSPWGCFFIKLLFFVTDAADNKF